MNTLSDLLSSNPRLSSVTLVALIALACSSPAFCDEIHKAAGDGDLDRVKALVKNRPDLVFSKDTAHDTGWTPLHWAALKGHKDVAEFLLANNAEVDGRDKYGHTPLHSAANGGSKEVAVLLLAHGADVNAKADDGETPLHMAAFFGYKDVVEVLLSNKATINATDREGHTPLHLAVQQEHAVVAEFLRQHGGRGGAAKVAQPIFAAISDDDLDKVKVIVAATPAAVNAVDFDGETTLAYAASATAKNRTYAISLNSTANGTARDISGNNISPVAEFLISRGANVNARSDSGETPLMSAVLNEKSAFAKALIKKGAAVNVSDKEGWTALLEAAVTGDLDMFKALVVAGARLNVKKNNGQTAMHIAAERGNTEVIEYLIQRGGDVNAKDSKGATPLKLASFRNQYQAAALLKKNGAVE